MLKEEHKRLDENFIFNNKANCFVGDKGTIKSKNGRVLAVNEYRARYSRETVEAT